jgi:hypothetical protein
LKKGYPDQKRAIFQMFWMFNFAGFKILKSLVLYVSYTSNKIRIYEKYFVIYLKRQPWNNFQSLESDILKSWS